MVKSFSSTAFLKALWYLHGTKFWELYYENGIKMLSEKIWPKLYIYYVYVSSMYRLIDLMLQNSFFCYKCIFSFSFYIIWF